MWGRRLQRMEVRWPEKVFSFRLDAAAGVYLVEAVVDGTGRRVFRVVRR
jgi:hypothetical protein